MSARISALYKTLRLPLQRRAISASKATPVPQQRQRIGVCEALVFPSFDFTHLQPRRSLLSAVATMPAPVEGGCRGAGDRPDDLSSVRAVLMSALKPAGGPVQPAVFDACAGCAAAPRPPVRGQHVPRLLDDAAAVVLQEELAADAVEFSASGGCRARLTIFWRLS